MKAKHTLAIAAVLLASTVARAAGAPERRPCVASPAGRGRTAPQSEGEVRKVDLEQGKVTLRHGPLANLDMPAMTMVFTAADPKLLEGLKQGDKVRFTADKKDGTYIVTGLELMK